MDEALVRKLSKQLKIVNFFLILFSTVFLVLLLVLGYITYRATTEVQQARDSLNSLEAKAEENLNFKSNICNSDGNISALLKTQSNVCD